MTATLPTPQPSAALARASSVALVGNGPIWSEAADLVDRADLVVRMNLAPLCGVAGSRTDVLAINPRLLNNMVLKGKPVSNRSLATTQEFWSFRDVRHTSHRGLPVLDVGAGLLDRLNDALRQHGAGPKPSPTLGAVVLNYLVARSDAQITLFGFTHQGDPQHPWTAERAWFDSLAAEGRVIRCSIEGRPVRQHWLDRLGSATARAVYHLRNRRW